MKVIIVFYYVLMIKSNFIIHELPTTANHLVGELPPRGKSVHNNTNPDIDCRHPMFQFHRS